jgi:hypothetical protein
VNVNGRESSWDVNANGVSSWDVNATREGHENVSGKLKGGKERAKLDRTMRKELELLDSTKGSDSGPPPGGSDDVTRCGDSVERDTGVRCVLVRCLAGRLERCGSVLRSGERACKRETSLDLTRRRREMARAVTPRAARRQNPNFATCMTVRHGSCVKNSHNTTMTTRVPSPNVEGTRVFR